MQAVVEDGVAGRADPRHHLHREGRRRDEDARARRASSSSGGARTPAPPRAPGSPRSTASARGCCAPTRSAPGSTPTSACSTSSRPSASALDAFDGALEDFLGEGEDPRAARAGGLLHARPPARHGAHRLLAPAQPRRAPPEPGARRSRRAPAAERERLEAAARAALAELGRGRSGQDASPRAHREARALRGAARAAAGARELADAARARGARARAGNAKALCTRRLRRVPRGARRLRRTLCRGAARVPQTTRCCACCSSSTASRYERGKRDRSGLDFEDLELLARDLLAGDEGLREQYAERFDHVLVDEFQDINPLQNELLALLERDNLFRVGRREPVDLRLPPRRRRASSAATAQAADGAGRAESVTVNFRSRGELLDADRPRLRAALGRGLRAAARGPAARARTAAREPCVELLVTDQRKQRWDDALLGDGRGTLRRRAMRGAHPVAGARGAAARASGSRSSRARAATDWRDIVVLLRATTHMGFYERALEERGIPTHVVGGRGYWSPAAGGRPAPLAGGAGQPARRAGPVQRARLAAGRALARRRGADRPARREQARRDVVVDGLASPTGSADELPAGDRRRLRALRARCSRPSAAGARRCRSRR